MKQAVLIFLLAACSILAPARVADTNLVSFPGGKCLMYRIYLQDKDLEHNPFSIDRPEEFLSLRSIERRKRQKLAVDLTDLPVAPAYVEAVRQAGVEIVGRSKWNNTLLVRVHKEKQLRRLQELPFITRKVKVFASPDSVSQRKRTSFRKELSVWESNGETYGSADAQISSLGGKRLHDSGFRGKGMMIAVFEIGRAHV